MQIAEYGVTTVKITNGPEAPVDWATNKGLFPGCTVSLKNVFLTEAFKQGTVLSGDYVLPPSQGDESKSQLALDMEMPKLAFEAVVNNGALASRNTILSTQIKPCTDDWANEDTTNKTKMTVNDDASKVSELLNASEGTIGSWKAAERDLGLGADAKQKAELEGFGKGIKEAATYGQSNGFFSSYGRDSNGPTLVVPIPGRGVDVPLTDKLPGENGKAFPILMENAPQDAQFFEGALYDAGNTKQIFGSSFKDGRTSGGPWVNLAMDFYAKAKGSDSPVVNLDGSTGVLAKVSLTSMSQFMGSKQVETIVNLTISFLPLCDFVVSLEMPMKNVSENAKAAETWDARVSTVDFHSALVKYAIPLDKETVCAYFEDQPIYQENSDVAKTLNSSPKQLLACGFVLLNEVRDARGLPWLEKQAEQMAKILEHGGRKAIVTIEMRAINPNGFEAHKQSLEELGKKDEIGRIEHIGPNWPIYAVILVKDQEEE